MVGRPVSAAEPHEADAFLAMLRAQPGEWNRAKAEAFERLLEAFPDPNGPPEWALRQIVRGQFDRRLPATWRPVFIEVFHQWLGFRADSDAARDEHPASLSWWLTPLVPPLRRHGWAGAPISPLGLLACAVLFAWSGFVSASRSRSHAVRRSDGALAALAVSSFDWREAKAQRALEDASDAALIDVLAMGAQSRLQRDVLMAEQAKAVEELGAAAEVGGTWWAWPWADVSAR